MGDVTSLSQESQCRNIRSKRRPSERCENQATHGEYCGIHHKRPILWKSTILAITPLQLAAARTLLSWYRHVRGIFLKRRHGIGYWVRSVSTNDTDFFSTDPIQDISGNMFFSYMDEHKHVYSFDIRSIQSLYLRASASNPVTNPFTRNPIPAWVESKKNALVSLLRKRNLPTEWIPLQPPTPEQQWRMKVVDIFHKIDELNYYSSPDWFIQLNHYGQIKLYRELYDIWVFRAGLSIQQKNTIVPLHAQKLFRHTPWSISELPMESLQRVNMNVIRMMIQSAADRNDRILGAMYVVTAFTLVNRQARTAYPWLYETVSVQELEFPPNVAQEDVQPLANIFSVDWLNAIFHDTLPPLMLPPPELQGEQPPSNP